MRASSRARYYFFAGSRFQAAGDPGSPVVPYYRFMNATAAVMPLTALGAVIAIRWFLGRSGAARIAGLLAALLVVGSLGWILQDGLRHRWVAEANQWADQDVRVNALSEERFETVVLRDGTFLDYGMYGFSARPDYYPDGADGAAHPQPL